MKQLITVENLCKSYHLNVLMDDASFNIYEKQKVGVIGRNGAGKSTLFKILLGFEKQDSGTIKIHNITRIGYLKQEDDFLQDDTILSYLQRITEKEEWQCSKISAKFNFTPQDMNKLISNFSGGYKMRIKLVAMLLLEPNLLLLDEPTNYLDLSTMLLLEKFLQEYKGAYLIISHDRRFLENVCEEILEIENGKIKYFPQKLNDYLEYKKQDTETRENYNKKQIDRIKHLQKFVDRFGAKASKATQAQSKLKQIQKIQLVDVNKNLPNIKIRVPQTQQTKGRAVSLQNLTIGYLNKIVAKNISIDILKGEHIGIVGDNGQGKSTFFKTLVNVIPKISGEINFHPNLKIGYYAQHITSELNFKDTVESYLLKIAQTQEEMYKMAGSFLFHDDDLYKTVALLSGGEKARLCLAGLMLGNFDILFLDEPTNHLDFQTSEILAHSLSKSNLTILFISHDRTFTSILGKSLIEVKNNKVERSIYNYEEYIQKISSPVEKREINNNEESSNNKIIHNEIVLNNLQKEYRKNLIEERKIILDKIKKIEKDLEKKKKEKEDIILYFLKNPTCIDIDKTKRLSELSKNIEALEKEWLVESEKNV